MAPYFQESAGTAVVTPATLPSKNVTLNHDNVAKPVADDFMYDFKYNHALPTTDILGITIPVDCDAQKEADGIVARLSQATSKADAQAFGDLFLDYGKIIYKALQI